MPTWVIKRLHDGKFYKNGVKTPEWKTRDLSREQLREKMDAVHWTPDLQRARTYTNRGGAKSALPYQASETDYAFIEVELVEKGS